MCLKKCLVRHVIMNYVSNILAAEPSTLSKLSRSGNVPCNMDRVVLEFEVGIRPIEHKI